MGSAQLVEGSLFVDEPNGRVVIMALQCLRHLHSASTHDIYWRYMIMRGMQLDLPFQTAEHLALARLVCLNRVLNEQDLVLVRHAWETLSTDDQRVLTEHFIKDGISEKAFVFEFLPDY